MIRFRGTFFGTTPVVCILSLFLHAVNSIALDAVWTGNGTDPEPCRKPRLLNNSGIIIDCTVCSDQSICLGPAGPNGCVRMNDTHDGFNSNCAACKCYEPSQSERKAIQFRRFSTKEMYYHLHMSKTGGTTFENILRNNIVQYTGLKMCDEALNMSFKLPIKNPPYFASPQLIRPDNCQIVSFEGRLRDVEKQFPIDSSPVIITFLRNPIFRTWSQFNHDRHYWAKRSIVNDALSKLYENPELTQDLDGRGTRYGDWQLYRLSRLSATEILKGISTSDINDVKSMISKLPFIGIAENYRVSLCLFYFTFQIHAGFQFCMKRKLRAYNSACYEKGENAKECHNNKEQLFTNKFGLRNESELMAGILKTISHENRQLIEEHTKSDSSIYNFTCDLFWHRVSIMSKITGKIFNVPE